MIALQEQGRSQKMAGEMMTVHHTVVSLRMNCSVLAYSMMKEIP
jgi:hypothetical protein